MLQHTAQSQPSSEQFEYIENIKKIPQCPPADAIAMNKTAWRFTHSPFCTCCFLPALKKNPKRKVSDESSTCSMWALSMYDSENEAVSAYAKLKKTYKLVGKAIGDHLSSGNLSTGDGKCTLSNTRNGHFDFHPYINVSIGGKFQIIRALP